MESDAVYIAQGSYETHEHKEKRENDHVSQEGMGVSKVDVRRAVLPN